jgi:hypothetical protein
VGKDIDFLYALETSIGLGTGMHLNPCLLVQSNTRISTHRIFYLQERGHSVPLTIFTGECATLGSFVTVVMCLQAWLERLGISLPHNYIL